MTDFAAQLKVIQDARLALEADEHDKAAALDAQEQALIDAMQAAQAPPPVPVASPPVATKPNPPAPAAPAPGTVPTDPTKLPVGTDPAASPPVVTKPTASPPIVVPPNTMRMAVESAMGVHYGYRTIDISGMVVYGSTAAGGLRAVEGGTGAADELGLNTGDVGRAVITMDTQLAWASVLSTADDVDNWPYRVTDKTTGDMPAKPWLNIRQSFQGDASNLVGDTRPNPLGLEPDGQHEPHPLFGALVYLLLLNTADSIAHFQRLLILLKTVVSWNYFMCPAQSRGPRGGPIDANGQPTLGDPANFWMDGILDPEASTNDERGEAWRFDTLISLQRVLELAKAAGITTPDDGWYAWTKNAVQSNIYFLDHKYRIGDFNNAYATPYYDMKVQPNPLGLLRGDMTAYGNGPNGDLMVIGAFQEAFQATVIGWLSQLNLDLDPAFATELNTLANWALAWPVMLAGNPADPTAYPYQHAGEYQIAVAKRNADGSLTYARNGGDLWGWNYPNTPRPTTNVLLYHDGPNPQGDLYDGYFSNWWPGFVFAYDRNLPGTREGMAFMKGSDLWKKAGGPDFSPAFAYMTKGEFYDDTDAIGPSEPVASPPVTTDPTASPPVVITTAPRLVGFDPATGTLVATEVSLPAMASFTPTTDGVYMWGAQGKFFAITLKAGVAQNLDYKVLGDPSPGVAKALYKPGTPAVETPPAGPVASPPIVKPVASPPIPEGPVGTLLGKDGDNIQAVNGHGKYGVTLTEATATFDGSKTYPPGDYYVDVVLKAGPLTITPAGLGVADPCYGIQKALYLVEADSTPVASPPVTTPVASPPVTTPSGVADHGSAGYTIEETGDDHIALPGLVIDPRTWAPAMKQGKSLPMRNTLLASLPSWYQDIANSVINNWPGFAWLKSLQGLWGSNGGHQVMEANYAVMLFPKCLMWQARNYAQKAISIADAEAGLDTGPDDIGAGDLPDAMHGYGGILSRDGDLDVGPEAVVYATNYRNDASTNDIHMINPKVLNGGGWAMYAKGRGIPIGNYAQAAVSRKRKGFFIGDSRDGRMFFCPFDPKLMWSQVNSVIPQWSNGTMLVDDDREIIIGICGAVDPYYDGVSPNHMQKLATGVLVRNLFDDAGAITTLALDVSTNPIVGLNTDGVTAEFEPDRCGIKYAPGCGFFGVKKTSAGGHYVHFAWKNPTSWQAGLTPVSIWDVGVDVPIPSNDVYGSLSVEQHFKDIETSVLPANDPIRQRWFALHPVSHIDAPFMSGLDVTE